MTLKKVLKAWLDEQVYTAKYVEMPETGDPGDIICQECLVTTQMDTFGDIIKYGLLDDIHWTLFKCSKCDGLYVVRYTLSHEDYGAIYPSIPDIGLRARIVYHDAS